jgi:hypothetical protein
MGAATVAVDLEREGNLNHGDRCSVSDKRSADGEMFDSNRVILRNGLGHLQRTTGAGIPVRGPSSAGAEVARDVVGGVTLR